MWELEFDISAVEKGQQYIINCPTEELERELACALDNIGLHYPDSEHLSSSSHWKEYGEEFCYFIYKDYVVRRGDKSGVAYFSGIASIFLGNNTPDFEPATDDELLTFLGIGGG